MFPLFLFYILSIICFTYSNICVGLLLFVLLLFILLFILFTLLIPPIFHPLLFFLFPFLYYYYFYFALPIPINLSFAIFIFILWYFYCTIEHFLRHISTSALNCLFVLFKSINFL